MIFGNDCHIKNRNAYVSLPLGLCAAVVLLFLPSGRCSAESADVGKKTVEFFAAGQKYVSFDDYRTEKLKAIAREEFQHFLNANFEPFLIAVRDSVARGDEEVFTDDEYRILLREVFARVYLHETTEPRKNPVTRQLNDMLEEYNRTHADTPELFIDGSKVKTIELPKK